MRIFYSQVDCRKVQEVKNVSTISFEDQKKDVSVVFVLFGGDSSLPWWHFRQNVWFLKK